MAGSESTHIFQVGRTARAAGLACIGLALIIALMGYVFLIETMPGGQTVLTGAPRLVSAFLVAVACAALLALAVTSLLNSRNARVILYDDEIKVRDWLGREQAISLTDLNAMLLRWRRSRWGARFGWAVLDLLRTANEPPLARIWTVRFIAQPEPPDEWIRLTAAISARRQLSRVDYKPERSVLRCFLCVAHRYWRR